MSQQDLSTFAMAPEYVPPTRWHSTGRWGHVRFRMLYVRYAIARLLRLVPQALSGRVEWV